MLEKDIEKYVCDWAKRMLGAWCIKLTPRGFRGLPDRMMLFPGGRVCFIEFKAPGKVPRPLQWVVINKLRKYGFHVIVCDNRERGRDELRAFAEGIVRPS